MKRFLFLLSAICLLAAGQEIKPQGKISDFKPTVPQRKPKKIDMNLPESPLVVNGSKTPTIELGRVFKLNQRLFPITIENPSDKDIEYDNIVINCNCTSIVNRIPKAGKIPAKSKMPLLIRLNAPQLAVEKSFVRMIRLELKGYRQFQINFAGEVSGSLYATFYDDPNQVARTKITVGYIVDTDAPWSTIINIATDLENENLELDKVERSMLNFKAELKKISDKHWQVELKGKTPMKPGIIKDILAISLKSPVPADKLHKDLIYMPIEGIIGMQLVGSAEEVLIDKQIDKEEVVEKAIIISRSNFLDPAMIRATMLGKEPPYTFTIDPLTVEEMKVKAPEGVEVTMEKYKNGIYATFKMQTSKLNEDGVYAIFQAPKTKALKVRLAILGDKERAELKEEAEQKKREEEEERKKQAEQDAIQ
ncbi:MAG: hypothetical protein IJS08_08935 [Victivallales bacterium]|nr:hypothetical protein [Victivallales bacterium]